MTPTLLVPWWRPLRIFALASSSSVQIHEDVLANLSKMADVEPGKDCSEGEPFDVASGGKTYSAMISRLPGEAD